MSFFPHTRLFSNETKTVDIAGSHIQVLDTKTGAILHSTTNLPETEPASLVKAGPIRCAAVDRELKYLLTSGEDKILKLWSLEDMKLVNERELPKKPTALAFTADAQTLLVSDKFGDVFSYPFTYTPLPTPTSNSNTPENKTQNEKEKEKEKEKDTLASHENPSNGHLVLGHVSPLNAFLLSPDERYILTADRDEHIRVSQYPRGYNIEMYCLGHLKFVSAIHIPTTDPSTLISGGGDPMLKIWDWMSGALKHEVQVLDVVEPFIAVKASRNRRWFEAAEGGEGEVPESNGKAKRGKRGKGRGKNKQQGKQEEEAEAVVQEGEVVREREGEEEAEEAAATPTGAAVAEAEEGVDPDTVMEDASAADAVKTTQNESEGEKVLVIRRIESVRSSDDGDGDGTYVVFSAVGATAVFAFKYTPEEAPSDIRHFDFGKPVLDFTVLGDRTILANIDGQWTPSESEDKSMARALKISNGQLVEDQETLNPLLASLNSTSLIPSTPSLLKTQNLYGDLISLPKYVDATDTGGDEDAEPQPIGAPVLSSSEVAKARGKGKGNTKGKGNLKAELTKKELGRIRTKQAVAAKALENQNQAGNQALGNGKRPASGGAGPEPEVGLPDAKRARSEVSAGVDVQQDDGSMNTTT